MSTPHTSHTPFLPPQHTHARTPDMVSALQPHPTAFQCRPSPPLLLPSPLLSPPLPSPPSPAPPLAPPGPTLLPPRLPQVNPSANVVVRGEEQRYVCRAGYKLEKGLQHFNIDVNGKVRKELRLQGPGALGLGCKEELKEER